MASRPPTRTPSTTRGSLIWNRTALSSELRPECRWTNGILSASAAAVASGFRSAAPTMTPTSAAATRKIAAAASAPAGLMLVSRGRRLLDRLGDLGDKQRQPRTPPRRHVVVQADDLVVPHRGDGRPAWTLGDHGRALAAVRGLVVGQEDELRPGRHDVLLRQLRVAAVGRLVGGVRDVLKAEQAHYLPDERLRRDRVERAGAQLPVIGLALVGGAGLAHVGSDLRFHVRHHPGGLRFVAGRLADL